MKIMVHINNLNFSVCFCNEEKKIFIFITVEVSCKVKINEQKISCFLKASSHFPSAQFEHFRLLSMNFHDVKL